MAIPNLFSRRTRILHDGHPTPRHDVISIQFRYRLCHLFTAGIGPWRRENWSLDYKPSNISWSQIEGALLRLHGMLPKAGADPEDTVLLSLLNSESVPFVLDVCEACLKFIDREIRYLNPVDAERASISESPDTVIDDFNTMCREEGVGYAYRDGELVTVGASFTHAGIVDPALTLLHDRGFQGADHEFKEALRKLRAGDHSGAVVDACRAFESTLKTICAKKGIPLTEKNNSASGLVDALNSRGYFPTQIHNQLNQLVGLLKSGLPTIRNKPGVAHGAGENPVQVSREIAEYAIHMAASNMLFLVKLL